mmetsp:Transcript_40073/g.45598  ORF Transcript_40073/g.45598 Transcript_40073/m.45598 type:complete len:358 (+) Transcript_40073:119-1192(+)|eukprot:CAMPEP_0194137224 /NCGR_PEP_ID=MMETSP0152-20130528/7150_1 /TAXON_ID=1049557 /ORGANISM="Thalassiothrix antarctica, Strain L6-D1" /LENGTH=357 /DNA_ID=CAMNT_0038834169 /DNA_START=48 /DNA_END=1121 /DNA_ORIENTATION=-
MNVSRLARSRIIYGASKIAVGTVTLYACSNIVSTPNVVYADAGAAKSSNGGKNTNFRKKSNDVIDIMKIRDMIHKVVDEDMEKRGDGTSLLGTFIRLASHCSATYSKDNNSGGSWQFNPKVESQWKTNVGLEVAKDALESVKLKNPEISYSDLYTLAGTVAIEKAGGPSIPFRCGRQDMNDEDKEGNNKNKDKNISSFEGRLPIADMGSTRKTIRALRTTFYRMGFNDRDIVALSGAKCIGRCHTDRTGYYGPWTHSENKFSNEYYKSLLREQWTPKVTHNGKPWTGPDQYEDSATGKLIMLPSDMALLKDPEFRKYAEAYARDERLFSYDFARAFAKLLNLGIPSAFLQKPWYQFW